jgi:hypothetical protein
MRANIENILAFIAVLLFQLFGNCCAQLPAGKLHAEHVNSKSMIRNHDLG